MRRRTWRAVPVLAGAALCMGANALDSDQRWTTHDTGAGAYRQPVDGLAAADIAAYEEGEKAFALRWTPRGSGPWGQGPVSNAASCLECHAGKGRTPVRSAEERLVGMLVRLSVPGGDAHGGPRPHPAYGDQLNDVGMFEVPPEGYASVRYSERRIAYADGKRASLRVPEIVFEKLNFGPLGPDALTSARAAPPLVGLGLIDAVAAVTIVEQAARQSALGLRGHANLVWDVAAAARTVGRFGRKANQPHLYQQVLAAFHGDIGVTSELFAEENCMPVQAECLEKKPFMKPELTPGIRNGILFYLRASAAPARRDTDAPAVRRGEALFDSAGCAACHLPSMRTAAYPDLPELGGVTFHPYTDLLVHDMGPDLADGRPDYEAGPAEWRTAPLWGIGLAQRVNPGAGFLHDGRARDFAEAILWHGGEAERAQEVFRAMPDTSRADLLAFLASL